MWGFAGGWRVGKSENVVRDALICDSQYGYR
jgi:hypothetical protein